MTSSTSAAITTEIPAISTRYCRQTASCRYSHFAARRQQRRRSASAPVPGRRTPGTPMPMLTTAGSGGRRPDRMSCARGAASVPTRASRGRAADHAAPRLVAEQREDRHLGHLPQFGQCFEPLVRDACAVDDEQAVEHRAVGGSCAMRLSSRPSTGCRRTRNCTRSDSAPRLLEDFAPEVLGRRIAAEHHDHLRRGRANLQDVLERLVRLRNVATTASRGSDAGGRHARVDAHQGPPARREDRIALLKDEGRRRPADRRHQVGQRLAEARLQVGGEDRFLIRG